jgi:hypothetical protein
MNGIDRFKKSAEIVGQVVGLFMGSKFIMPANKELEKHPYLTFGA